MTGRGPAGGRGMAEARGIRPDGDDIQTLLGSTTLSDAVHADWEAELLAEQASKWSHDINLPSDPPASAQALSSRSDTKGKGRAFTSGDISPVSSDLISSLSSLDLNSRSYLKTLLSLPPDEALEDYFSRGTYTDDVYGLPADVQKLFEKAQSGGQSQEEGRAKAVRRLGMVMKHLWGGEEGSQVVDASFVSTPSVTTSAEQRASSAESIAEEYDATQAIRPQQQGESFSSTHTAPDYRQSTGPHSINAMQQQYSHPLHQQQHSTPFLSSSAQQLDPHSTPYVPTLPPTHQQQQRPIFSPSPLRHEQQQIKEQQPDDDEERTEGDGLLPPFSQFLQTRLDEMALLGGRRTPTPLMD